jgi:hypothetical protein
MIYWVLINYFNENDIINLMEANNIQNVTFIVVDNSNTFDHSLIIHKNTHVLRPNSNLGYIGGFQFALQKLNLYENKKVILSNSDIKLLCPLDNLNLFSESSIIVPQVSNLDNKLQNPHMVFKPSKRFFCMLKFFSSKNFLWFIFLFFRKFKNIILTHSISRYDDSSIYAGHGSFIYFNNLNLTYFKEKEFNFLFGEEIHFAEFAKCIKYSIFYKPLFTVLHNEHSTTSAVSFSRKRIYYFDSYKFILNNYYN